MVSRILLEESTRGKGAKAKQSVGHGCVQAGLKTSFHHQQSRRSLAGGTWGGQPGWREVKHLPSPWGLWEVTCWSTRSTLWFRKHVSGLCGWGFPILPGFTVSPALPVCGRGYVLCVCCCARNLLQR